MISKLWQTVSKRFRLYQQHMLDLADNPHEAAKAFAVGVFIGVMPAMGAIVALFFAVLLRLNKTATVLGSFTSNPWTLPFIYAASYKIGKWVTTIETPIEWRTIFTFQMGWHKELYRAAPTFLTGCVIFAMSAAIISYIVVRMTLSAYHRQRLLKAGPPL